MPLSWNEIKRRAIAFSRDWKGTTSEKSERQTFWNEFFEVFGKKRRTLAAFEEPVKKLSGNWGFIDLFWPGTCLVEHKSAGQDLDKAHAQGMDYIRGLTDSGRDKEVPRWLIVSDFQRIAIHDLEPEQDPDLPLFTRQSPSVEFELKDLHKNVRHFSFIAGYKYHKLNPEDPANFEATELMAKLHDALYDGGYRDHRLCQFLVRLLFCFFADDTGIFPSGAFKLFLRERTAEDGSDLGAKLGHLFQILNTPPEERGKNLDEDLAQFDYINGDLFTEPLQFADFTTTMRGVLMECSDFKWDRISPAVFGSLFQTVFDHQDDRKRRQLGAHYTTELNIMKIVRSLFLDELRNEFEAARKDKSGRGPGRLRDLQKKLACLTFLDPACGCGNFLVVTYRELRRLELEILLELEHDYLEEQQDLIDKRKLDVSTLSKINVDQMYGIELDEFPARIAEVALWLADHQANTLLSEAFGDRFTRIPLRNSPHIHVANALRKDWKEVLAPQKCGYILGNPPFVGHHYQSAEQKEDQQRVMVHIAARGVIDFVANWHLKAAEYIRGTTAKVAFVSTNSLCQGEQASLLWSEMFGRYGIKIHFAHRTFAWQSEARGKAHVHCVIVGFANFDTETKWLYDYDSDPINPTATLVRNISPYLVEGPDRAVGNRSEPLSDVPKMSWGNKPTDGGHLILSPEERSELLSKEPGAAKFVRPFMGGGDFINGEERYCLWLKEATPDELQALPMVMKRIEGVKQMRLASRAETTRNYAAFPSLFRQDAQPSSDYLAVPEVSSERRSYIPIAFLTKDVICSNTVQVVPEATIWHFGILTSSMHMAWMRLVCGRLKSDYRYSNTLVYNNFPWPEVPSEAQVTWVEKAAQAVLDARAKFPTSTLADLYDPTTMPPVLAKAHADLDRAVDRCYRRDPFSNDRTRVEHLFALYERLSSPLTAPSLRRRQAEVQKAQKTNDQPSSQMVHSAPLQETREPHPDGRGQRPVPDWFREALHLVSGGQEERAITLFHDEIATCLRARDFRKCDRILSAITQIVPRVPLELLVGVLTATHRHAINLPERKLLRRATAIRLLTLNKDAESILRGI